MNSSPDKVFRGGFTLIETAITVVVVGVAIAAMMVAVSSSTRLNAEAGELTTATLLAQHTREWTSRLPLFDPRVEAHHRADRTRLRAHRAVLRRGLRHHAQLSAPLGDDGRRSPGRPAPYTRSLGIACRLVRV